jgi:predicted RecB family nuclease
MFTLDPYAARSCPVKTHNAFHPGVVRPETASGAGRLPGSAEFIAATYERIIAGDASVVDLRTLFGAPSEEQEAACLAAMADGTQVIIGGLLPRDWDEHRSGRADLLVRDASGGYFPGLVKYQRVLDARKGEVTATFSAVGGLPERYSALGWRYRWHWRWGNALQLVHLWHLLGTINQQAASGPHALIVGSDDVDDQGLRAIWIDLADPVVSPAPGQAGEDQLVSALDRYDHEFGARVRLAEAASAAAPTDPPLLRPIVSFECGYCPWWSTCRPQLDDDDLSLRISKSPLDVHEIAVLRNAGVATVSQLASSDLELLLPGYLPQVAHRTGAEERLRLAQRRSQLLLEGVLLERTTTGPIEVPCAALEIDIDVETSREDRVYLWGFWVADGNGSGAYHEFSGFTELDEAAERELARAAMNWLRGIVGNTDARIYHYSDYEMVRLGRLARGEPGLDWAMDFAHEHFVDLFPMIRQNFFGTNGLGLKVVASAGAGFHWRDDDPGGLNSMRWFEEAVHGPTEESREQARVRVLEYNEDDVKATWHLRRWLRELSA